MLVPSQHVDPRTNQQSIVYNVQSYQWDGRQWREESNTGVVYRPLDPSARSALLLAVPSLIDEFVRSVTPPPPYRYLVILVLTSQGWGNVLSWGNWERKPLLQI